MDTYSLEIILIPAVASINSCVSGWCSVGMWAAAYFSNGLMKSLAAPGLFSNVSRPKMSYLYSNSQPKNYGLLIKGITFNH